MSEVLFFPLDTNIIQSIQDAISKFREDYGEPKRIWVNAKDISDDILEVEGFEIERRGGCARGKVMIF